jgi:hypothetical protein
VWGKRRDYLCISCQIWIKEIKTMKSKKELTVYWSPSFFSTNENEQDWNMLYRKPYTLFSEISKQKEGTKFQDSFFACPAFKNKMQNTFVFSNSIHSEYVYGEADGKYFIENVSKNYITAELTHDAVLSSGPIVHFSLGYIFFCEEEVDINVNSPVFHKAKYTKYGSMIPGRFSIGSWFRPINFEVQMWDRLGTFILEKDEPILYIDFLTDYDIKLQRFTMNEKLKQYYLHCSNSPFIFGRHKDLPERYDDFNKSDMKSLILKEIKSNLVGE